MAFGFRFNKTKVLHSAEKCVQQGKLQNAIAEYEKVIKEDPNDLTVQNTIGDLYARVGQVDRAAGFFRKVGDAYATDGFTVKAIAMYKKLTKLNPSATDCVIKLAELYTQQGLHNDARSQYMQVANQHMRSGELESAARIFQKMLELDPENAAMQSKLADLYVRLGKKTEARDIFSRTAESLYSRGTLDAADAAFARVLTLEPGNSRALVMRGKIALDSGDGAAAVGHLEKIAQIDSLPEGLAALLRAHLLVGNLEEVEPVARKLLSVHNDLSGIHAYVDALIAAGSCEKAIQLCSDYSDRLLAADPAAFVEFLNATVSRVKDNPAALELVRSLYEKAGDTTHIAEVMELLAHALVQSGQLEKARDLYQHLAEVEPENPLHQQNYRQIVAKLGEDAVTRPLTREEGAQALMADELEFAAPPLDQQYPEEVGDVVKAAITDSELFDSYNLPAKAIAPLEAIRAKVPLDVRVNQRLASLYARSERFDDAALSCVILQKIYSEAGFDDQARQYGEMAAKYADRAGLPGPPALPEMIAAAPAPAASAVPVESEGQQDLAADTAPEFEFPREAVSEIAATTASAFELAPAPPAGAEATAAHEIDFADEWEDLLVTEPPTAVAPPAVVQRSEAPGLVAEPEEPALGAGAEVIEEARFYLSQSMWDEARGAIERCEQLAPQSADLAELKQQLAAATAPAAPAAEPPAIEMIPESTGPAFTIEVEPESDSAESGGRGTVSAFVFDEAALGLPPRKVPVAPPLPAEAPALPEIESPPPLADTVAEPQLEAPLAEVPWRETQAQAPATAPAPADVLGAFASDLEQALPPDFGVMAPPSPEPAPPPRIAPMAAPPPPVSASVAAIPVAPAPVSAAAMAAAPAAEAPAALVDSGASSALSDLFAEFKEDVEESADKAEDPETHYNLGVAFKEMGLLDEAIGELQKVCHAMDHGQPFTHVMQTYTWLAQCFLEKGVPEAGIRWYEKALTLPAGDESRTALHYELACAHEAAGDRRAALSHFMEVYGTNIDYRDVAERIKALKS